MKTIKTLIASAAITAIGGMGATYAEDSELVIFDWGGYEDPNFFPDYIEKHGMSPTYSFFTDEEEAFQKMRAGFRADLGHPCSQSVVKWREAGMLEPIDTSRLSRWDDVISEFKTIDGFNTDGNQWVVPVDWGLTALTYITDLVDAADTVSLQSFADPKFAGRVSLPDNVDDAYALGYLAVGINDWNKATDADFQKASDFLRKVHQNIRTYWADGAEIRSLMASGEVTLSWSWNEVGVILESEGHPVAINEDTTEGKSTWLCGYVILKDGQGNKDKAYDFLNAWLDERSGEYMVNEWGYGHSNSVAMDKHGPGAGFGTLESYSEGTLWQAPVSADHREKMIAEFELIKAGF